MKTLRDMINDGDVMTEKQKQALYDLLKQGKRGRNRDLLHSRIFNVPLSLWPSWGMYGRIQFNGDCIDYCTGQDFNVEMREISGLIIGS